MYVCKCVAAAFLVWAVWEVELTAQGELGFNGDICHHSRNLWRWNRWQQQNSYSSLPGLEEPLFFPCVRTLCKGNVTVAS